MIEFEKVSCEKVEEAMSFFCLVSDCSFRVSFHSLCPEIYKCIRVRACTFLVSVWI